MENRLCVCLRIDREETKGRIELLHELHPHFQSTEEAIDHACHSIVFSIWFDIDEMYVEELGMDGVVLGRRYRSCG